MRNRKKITKKKSRKLFRRTAAKTHPKNTRAKVMRGGTRL